MNLILKWENPSALYFLIVVIFYATIYIALEKHFTKKLDSAFGKKVASYLTQSLSITKRRIQI